MPLDPLSIAGIGLGAGGILGGIGGAGAKKAYVERQDQLYKLWAYLRGQQSINFGQGVDAYSKLAQIYDQGYQRAKAQVSQVGQAAKREAGDRQTQRLGAVNVGLQQSGLSNTTTAAGARGSAFAQTGREFQAINESLAGLFAGLEGARTQGLGAAQMGLASLYQNKAAQESSLGVQFTDLLFGSGPGPGSAGGAAGAAAAQGIGQLLPLILGGGL